MRLSAYESRIAATIGRALLPAGALGGLLDDTDTGARVAAQLDRSPWWSAITIRLGFWMVWLWPLFSSRPRSFGGLDAAAQVALLEHLGSSDRYVVRELVTLLKLTLCFALLGDPAVLAWLGAYDFNPRLGPRRRALGNGAA